MIYTNSYHIDLFNHYRICNDNNYYYRNIIYEIIK